MVDLRFADDILLFANSGPEVAQILDKFVKAVGKVGLRLNVDKTVILTNEAQPPNTLVTKDGLTLKVLERNQGQKWLGCVWTACGSMMQHMDLAYHMEQGTKTIPYTVRITDEAPYTLTVGGELALTAHVSKQRGCS